MEAVINNLDISKSVEKYETVSDVDFINGNSNRIEMEIQIDGQKQIKKHVNSIREQSSKRKKYVRRKPLKLTEEQRLKRNENERKKRANLSEEQRLKNSEHLRKTRPKLTEQQQLKKNEYQRKMRSNLSEKQRLKRKEEKRKSRANLTEEQRLKRNEYQRKYYMLRYSKKTDKRLTKEREYKHDKYTKSPQNKFTLCSKDESKKTTKLTQDQHLRRDENELEKSATITEEQCTQNPKTLNNQNVKQCMVQRTISEQEISESVNHLQKLIKQIRYGKNTSQPNKYLLRTILEMLNIVYPQNILLHNQHTLQKLNHEMDSMFLIELLNKWNGWFRDDQITHLSSCDDLFYYLLENFSYIRSHRDTNLLDEVNNFYPSDNYINASCSLKQLKSLFYYAPHNYINYYNEDTLASGSSYCSEAPFSSFIFNFPYISTQISLPNFSMQHMNIHVDEYHLLNMTSEKKSNLYSQNNCEILEKINNESNICETYETEFVSKFLSQLKVAIENDNEDNILFDRKIELIKAIIELEKDIAHCANTIQTNTTYTIDLAQNPYTRYLGLPDDGDINISIAEQKLLNETIFNVRLQEIRYPRISFALEKFSVQYQLGNDDFIFNESFLTKLNSCISYKCLLCDEDLGSYAPSQRISDHLLRYHGPEPDWECVKCSQTFSNNFLITYRWTHNCQ